MVKSFISKPALGLLLALPALAQSKDPFQPLDFSRTPGVLDQNGARQDWVLVTNKRMEMTGKTLRVELGDGGLTAVVKAKGVEKLRHAKPILYGKDEYKELFRSIVALGFNRIVVRNPDNGKQWAARLEQGKPKLEKD
jgi:hypothetical protein